MAIAADMRHQLPDRPGADPLADDHGEGFTLDKTIPNVDRPQTSIDIALTVRSRCRRPY